MKGTFLHLFPNDISTRLIRKPSLRSFYAKVIVYTKNYAFKKDSFFQLLDIFWQICSPNPFVSCRFFFKSINWVIFVINNISAFLKKVLKSCINYLSIAYRSNNFLRELKSSIHNTHTICSHIFLDKILDNSLYFLLLFLFFNDNVCLNIFTEHFRCWLIDNFYFISLNVMICLLFLNRLIINLKSEIAIEALLIFVLDWSVHDFFCIIGLRILDWAIL
jgi:hypothetical protein